MDLKQQAAEHALTYVRSGMRLGLGTGSTARLFVQALGRCWQRGELLDLQCVPTSRETFDLAQSFSLPVATLADLSKDGKPPRLNLAVDGADEVDPRLDLIKGLGKAALREKIIEMHAEIFVVIVDESKLVERLGRGPLPVEVIPFEAAVTVRWLASLGCRAELWTDEPGSPLVTDNQNWLVRCWFPDGIADPHALADRLNARPGVVEHGLFLNLASEVIVAGKGGVRVLGRHEN